MIKNEGLDSIEPVKSGFQSFEHAAADIVLAASFNPAGTRAALCSADHKIRVYSINRDKEWTLLEQFRGHDAEVLDIQWVSSSLGQFFATIGGDNKLKLWQEDPSQRPTKGRRFRCVYSQSPPNHVSYVSFGFKIIKHEIWIALITHDGSLSLMEPADPESLSSWNQVDQLHPFGQHHRGTEARFRLSIHQSEGPSLNALMAGLHLKAISLAVSALNCIKIFRAVKPEDASEGSYRFFEMLQIDTGNELINEIAWAPGCLLPFDRIAAACDGGTVRIFDVDTPHDVDGSPKEMTARFPQSNATQKAHLTSSSRNPPSGIGAGLAGMSRITSPRHDLTERLNIKHVSKERAILPHDEGSPVWKVRWTYDGSILASTGDNGKVRLWRESLNGDFIEYAETAPR